MKSSQFTLGAVAFLSLVGCGRADNKAAQAEEKDVTAAIQPTPQENKGDTAKDSTKKEKFSRDEVKKIAQEAVVDMLNNQPEMFVSAIERAMQRKQQEKIEQMGTKATKVQSKFWASKLVIGNKEAKLKVAIFIDPLDPLSQQVRNEVLLPLAGERSDVGFFLIPISAFEGDGKELPSSMLATKALIAAANQDAKKAVAFWEKMPPLGKEFPRTKILKAATEAGLDVKKLEKDLEDKTIGEKEDANRQLAAGMGASAQLPVIFLRFPDDHLEFLPPLVKEKMTIALDAALKGKPWMEAVSAAAEAEMAAAIKAAEEAAKEEAH